VLIALQNAFHELLHARTVEDGLRATILRGGDTDTNAAIAGRAAGRGARPRGPARAVALDDPELPSRARRPRTRGRWRIGRWTRWSWPSGSSSAGAR
jgi:hypothetical protein